MLDTPTKAGATDFKQRYCNGYGIYITESKKRIVVYLHTMTGGRLHFRDVEGQEYFVNFDTNAEFEFLPSVKGWHHQDHRAVLLARVPARQYNRGINHHNTTAMVFHGLGFGAVEVEHTLVDSLFGEPPAPVKERINPFLSGAVSFCVLSSYFCLTHGKVFLSNLQIGTYTKTKTHATITLSNPIASQELTDLITRNSLPMSISA